MLAGLGGCATGPGADIATSSIGPANAMISASRMEVSSAMPSGDADATPSGFVAFCGRHPDQCAGKPGEADTIAMTPENWDLLKQVNLTFNDAIKPMEDAVHYGRSDYWTIPTDGYGDCEDYALAKRKALADAGMPFGALRIAVAKLRNGEAHAVLTVATDKGDYVLNNLTNQVLPWDATGLIWVSRQVPGQAAWTSVGKSQVAGATAAIHILQ